MRVVRIERQCGVKSLASKKVVRKDSNTGDAGERNKRGYWREG